MKALFSQPQRVLVAVIVLSTLLRIGAALYLGNEVEILPGTYDQVSYDALAKRVINGHGFSFETDWWPATQGGEATAHWSFLYTLYLGVVYSVFGPNPLVARLIQAAVVGVLHPWLTWRIGTRLFDERVGLIAAALASIYAYFVYFAAALMTESFYILSILVFLDIATAMGARPAAEKLQGGRAARASWRPFVFLGLALGVTALLRQLIVLFVPFLFMWLWWRRCKKGQQDGEPSSPSNLTAGLVLTTLILAVMIAPWTVRNYRAFDQLVILNTNAGFAFFWGNHPVHGRTFVPILSARGISYQELIPAEMQGLNEAALDKALLRQGVGFVKDDPVRFFWLSLSRAKEYFKFWPSYESSAFSNLARVLSFGVCLPFVILGFAAPFLKGRFHNFGARRDSGLLTLLYLFVVVYTFIHVFSWTLIRYRLPVDSILIIFAAAGITTLLEATSRLGWVNSRVSIVNKLRTRNFISD